MARDDSPPFARGETWYGLNPNPPIDATSNATLGGVNYEGKEYVFEANSQDEGAASPATQEDTGRSIRVRCVRNVSGIALKPGRLAHYAATDPYETRIDGYTFATTDRPAGVVDEFLPAAGVPNNDLFYIVIDGPTKVTQLSVSASVLVIADRLVPGAGTSATTNDAGRVVKQDVTGATGTLAANIFNQVGYASVANNSVEDALFSAVVHRAYK